MPTEVELPTRAADALRGLTVFLTAVLDGELTESEIAAAIDAAVDTGPLDPLDDSVISLVVTQLAGLLLREPAKMRERADRLEEEGKLERAEKLRARADKVEAKRAD
jgi:hypothetical protein